MEKPNILLIMCDQLRADALGSYGNSLVRTPNIDRIAQQGVVFNRAYSRTPVCVPARYGLMSGKAPFQLGLIDNGPYKKNFTDPLPQKLKEQGYFTCAVGKMHFSPVREHYGFDRMYLSEEIPGHYHDDDYLQFLRRSGYGHVVEPHGKRSAAYYVPQTSELPEEMHTTAWTANTTCDVIRQNSNRPFFIYTSFIKPHPPFDPCEPYERMYAPEEVPMPIRREEERSPVDLAIALQNDYKVNGIENVSDDDVRKMRSHYYGLVSQIDKQVGKIINTLEQYNLLDNTLIIFTADHGEMLGDHYSFGKRTYYESSARIPLILSWPNKFKHNGQREHLAVLEDIYATAIAAAGGKVPEDSSGINLSGVAVDRGGSLRDEVYAEFGKGRMLKFMLRWDDYKYVYHTNGGIETLFNLREDPDEFRNIAADHKEICDRCRQKLCAYYRHHGFVDALDEDRLIKYDYEPHKRSGYLNQYPRWMNTVIT
jgi:arylsulfatase